MDGRFVGADQDAPAAQIAQFAHRRLRLLGQADQPLPVVLQDASGIGQRAALRRPVEQLLAEIDFEPADGLADGRLGAVHLGGRARKAALLGHGEKDPEGGQVHKLLLL